MNIKVRKYTNVDMLRRANAASTDRVSHMDLATAYRLGHTPVRTQKFEIYLEDIPQFVASQLVRQRQGVEWVMESKRPDRGGEDFKEEVRQICRKLWACESSLAAGDEVEETLDKISDVVWEWPELFDRYAPTNLWGDINAEALMNMAHKRLCRKASKETQEVVQAIKELVEEQDPALAPHMVPQCVYRGGICPEAKCCGYINSEAGQAALRFYKALFNPKNTEI